MATVYLAGGISGLSYKEATDWRNEATDLLCQWGHTVLDPMRDKEMLANEETLSFNYGERNERVSPYAIFNRDVADVNKSDVVFARLDTAKSVGTPWEIGYAYAKQKKIILVVTEELLSHPFVVGTTLLVYTDWRQALQHAKSKQFVLN
jgi:nucleoside 2-deoxyribosyltransferase